jgi:hypothetical protein
VHIGRAPAGSREGSMGDELVRLERDGEVFVLTMAAGENR